MKKLVAIICLVLMSIAGFTQNSRAISDQRAIMLMNYLQYSLSQVKKNPNKLVAEHEFDSIINNINQTALKDENIIAAYKDILMTMRDIKLLDNEKKHAEEMAERERKQAIYSIFSSPGSIFSPGSNPALSIAYAALSAGLNYAGTRAQINNKKLEAEFRIEQNILMTIDRERSDLYTSGAKVFQTRDDSNNLIAENVMDSFVDAVNVDNAGNREAQLKSMQKTMKMFPAYWYALGYAQQQNKDYISALSSYGNYEKLIKAEPVLKFDETICQIQFAKIDIYAALGHLLDDKDIQNSIKIIENEMKKTTPNEQARQMFAMAVMYRTFGDISSSDNELKAIEELGLSNWAASVNEFKTKAASTKIENEIINEYVTLIKKETLAAKKEACKSIEFRQTQDEGGLTVDVSKVGFKNNIQLFCTDSMGLRYTRTTSRKGVWDNVFTYEQLLETKVGFFSSDVYIFYITDYTHFHVYFAVCQGFFAPLAMQKIVLKKLGEKDRKLNIFYHDIYLHDFPSVESSAIHNLKMKNSRLYLLINSPSIDAKFKNSILAGKEATIKIEADSGKTYVFPDANNNNLFFEIK